MIYILHKLLITSYQQFLRATLQLYLNSAPLAYMYALPIIKVYLYSPIKTCRPKFSIKCAGPNVWNKIPSE